jgi:Flp pilus assembly CpaE family ATPase
MNDEKAKPRFDDSLAAFADALSSVLGDEAINTGSVLRDATGRLAFIPAAELSEDDREKAASAAVKRVGGYCRSGRVLLDPHQAGVSAVLQGSRGYWETVQCASGPRNLYVQDQRIVGQDWLLDPAPSRPASEPPRYVFASIKGGVGRTTALAVAAADIARSGKKVLVIDLDCPSQGSSHRLSAGQL